MAHSLLGGDRIWVGWGIEPSWTPVELMRMTASHARWRFERGFFRDPSQFGVWLFRIRLWKFVRFPDKGELISPEHFKGFSFDLNLKPFEFKWKIVHFGNCRPGDIAARVRPLFWLSFSVPVGVRLCRDIIKFRIGRGKEEYALIPDKLGGSV